MVRGQIFLRRMVAAGLVMAATFALITVHEARAESNRATAQPGSSNAVDPGLYREHHYDVTVTNDIAYRTTTDYHGQPVTLALDTYVPSNSQTKRPAVIFLHEGGFTSGNRSSLANYARDFATRGYVSVSIDYRLRPDMQWFDMAQRPLAARDAYDDAIAAIAWVRAHAAELGVDPSLVFAGGYSAGAVTAMELADPPPGAAPGLVSGAIAIAGYSTGAAQAGGSPVLDFHGNTDGLVPYSLVQNSCNADRAVGVQCRIVTYSGEGHEIGFTHPTEIADQGADFFADLIAAR
jgi:acetyl esterase/lipase